MIFLVLIFLFFVFFSIRPSGLSITEKGICYKKYVFLDQVVEWSSIREVNTGASLKRAIKENRGVYNMDIHHSGSELSNPFTINIKPYTLQGLALLVEALVQKSPHAKLDESTLAFRKNIAPSFMAEPGQRPTWKNAATWLGYILLTLSLFMLPGVLVAPEALERVLLPSALILFFFLNLWAVQFKWDKFLPIFSIMLNTAGSGGFLLLLWQYLGSIFGYNHPLIWSREVPFVSLWAFYILIGSIFSKTSRTKGA